MAQTSSGQSACASAARCASATNSAGGCNGFIPAPRLGALRIDFFLLPIQLEEANRRRIFDFEAMMRGDAAQRVIDMREMIDGHVADEGAFDGGVAQTPMQPAKENTELRHERKRHDQPVGIHTRAPQTSFATRS